MPSNRHFSGSFSIVWSPDGAKFALHYHSVNKKLKTVKERSKYPTVRFVSFL